MSRLKIFCVLLVLMIAPSVCSAGRRGLLRGRCRGCAPIAAPTVALAPEQAAPAPACPGCLGEIRARGCGCSDGCDCLPDACPCRLGKEPCNADCKCLLHGTLAPAVDSAKFPGVLADKLGGGAAHSINGKPASRREVVQALTATVPDDRAVLSLTVCGGTEVEREAALQNIAQVGLDKSCLVQSYPAESPILKPGFVTTGRPTVYLQSPEGKVLCRADKADLATMQSVRARVDAYDPTKDPAPATDWSKTAEEWLGKVPPVAWIALVMLVVILLRKGEK